MSDRSSASITLGGSVTRAGLARLVELAQEERLSTEWDGEVFQADHLVEGQPLRLMAHEVAGGAF